MTRRIFIDALPILGEGGISNYIRPLVEELIRGASSAGRWQLELFFRLGFRGPRSPRFSKWLSSMAGEDCVIHTTRFPNRLISMLWEKGWVGLPPQGRPLPEVVLATTALIPPGRGSLVGWFVYDLVPLKIPQFFGSSRREFLEKMQRCARRADFIIALSERTRTDIAELLGYPEEKIAVCYPGAAPLMGRPAFQPPATPGARPYVLYLGALALNKNVDGLLRIFARCIREHGLDMSLILIGKDFCAPGYWASIVNRLGVAGRVEFRGWVTDSEKTALLSGAAMLWQLSWYEGFGLPVLEAASCGVPVLTSNRGALPEIIRNPDQEVDPADEAAAAARAAAALRSPGVLSKWKAHGLQRAQEFSWAKSANELTAFMEAAIK